ncbi:MAG: hypothetical protein KIT16_13490 [Rhodospirillaceae bacterium]|nr:hypothetical protein [Rhodospirillaceae bacterium]
MAPAPPRDPPPNDAPLDAPYPLLRRFLGRIVPAAALFLVVAIVVLGLAVNRVIEGVYLEIAELRAHSLLHAIRKSLPATGKALDAGRLGEADIRALERFFATATGDPRLQRVKIYDRARRVLFSTNAAEIGGTEDNAALRAVIAHRTRRLVDHRERDGTRVYELYVPLAAPNGRFSAVMELYEPTEYLDRTVAGEIWPPLALSVAIFAALFGALYFVVKRGQADIAARTRALTELRQRLERLVSASAVGAVHAAKGGPLASRRIEATLLYTDLRGFTAFAEREAPETVIALLDALLAIEIEAVSRHGGDVDKMIGDALLARFAGPDRHRRALAAAAAILAGVRDSGLALGVGVGVHHGAVIVGALGPEARQDFTTIGDAVNTAARFCTAARAGEIVADLDTLAAAGWPTARAEHIVAKGKQAALAVGRFSTDDALAACRAAAHGDAR